MNEAEHGSVLPLLAVVLLVAAALVVAVGRLGDAAVARAHARRRSPTRPRWPVPRRAERRRPRWPRRTVPGC